MSEIEINSPAEEKEQLRGLVREVASQIEDLDRALQSLRSRVGRLSAVVEDFDGAAKGPARHFEEPASWTLPPLAVDEGKPERARTNTTSPQQWWETPKPGHASEWDSTADGASWPVARKKDDAWSDFPTPAISEGADASLLETGVTEPSPVSNEDGGLETGSIPHEADSAVEASAESGATADESGVDEATQPADGWADQSNWSQGFEWPAMKQVETAAPAQDEQGDVSAIVSQVRAELEAARMQGRSLPLDNETVADEPVLEAGAAGADDDEARRADVSRMVEAMRAEFAASKSGFDEGDEAPDSAIAEEDIAVEDETKTLGTSEGESVGAESKATDESKPAFAFADWSLQADSGGPPSLVVKDPEGRVQLANVYELLNQLECGDSAALLNYTPHSVTVGLPIKASIPNVEKLEAAVLTVFNRKCRVSTDGVRISVDIGTDPKNGRSEDAA